MDLIDDRDNKNKKHRFGLALGIFFLTIFIVLLFTIDFGTLARVTSNPDSFYVSSVVGLSMYPTAYTGDVFIIQKTDAIGFSLRVGDIIVYTYHGMNIGHRLISVENNKYVVKGDNNNSYEIVTYDMIVGKVIKIVSRYNPVEQFTYGLVI